eukprot:m.603110 g.603110  ORF g.603110 m.603110 type:complete len:141 (+) comp22452_c3_seq4:167-589(+)
MSDEAQEAFDLFEADEYGTISIEDLFIAVRGLGYTPSNQQLYNVLSDLNTDGRISYSTFCQVIERLESDVGPAGLLEAFKLFDKEGRGSIPMKDLQGVLMSWGQKLNRQEVDDFMKAAGLSEGSKMNYEELCAKLLAGQK